MKEVSSMDKHDDKQILFTVFTPTYNRVKTLPRVYESLKQQGLKSFEWIIIDDGSTDGTEQLVHKWKEEADFPIVYKWKINEGKHIAYNLAAKMANGILFTGIDSDDELLPQSLERFRFHWDNFSIAQKEYVAGIYYPGLDQHGNLIGTLFPEAHAIDDLIKIFWKYRIKGDKGAFWQTRALRMYPFPEQFKNIIVPEGILMHEMSKDWKVSVINEPLFKVWINESERDDHLSTQSILPVHYPAQRYYYMIILNYSLRHFTTWPKLVCGAAFRYAKLSFLTGQNIRRQYKDLKPFSAIILWMIFLPIAYVSYNRYKKKHML